MRLADASVNSMNLMVGETSFCCCSINYTENKMKWEIDSHSRETVLAPSRCAVRSVILVWHEVRGRMRLSGETGAENHKAHSEFMCPHLPILAILDISLTVFTMESHWTLTVTRVGLQGRWAAGQN